MVDLVGGMTEEEEALIEEIVAEEGAEELAGWHRMEPEAERASATHDTVLQWGNDDETIFVAVGFDEREGGEGERETSWTARMTSSDDISGVPTLTITSFSSDLETVLDRTINFLRSHNPNKARAEFTATIEGGVIIPIVDLLRRFARRALIEAHADGISIRGANFNALVELRIGESSMESYDVQRQGEISVDPEEWWESISSHNFSDDVTLEAGENDDGQITFTVQGHRFFGDDPVAVSRSAWPAVEPSDARFVTEGLDYRDVLLAAREAPADEVAFGVHEGAPILVSEGPPVEPSEGGARIADDDVTEAFRARFPAREVSGEQVVAVGLERLQEVRKAMPRPSQTDVIFTFKDQVPLLTEYAIDGVDVDLRVALLDSETIEDYTLSVPPAEIEVPEGPPDEPAEEAEASEGVEEALQQAVEETQEEEPGEIEEEAEDETEGVPAPPDDEEEPEETATIMVSLIGGTVNYNVPGRIPGAVEDEAIGAARDTLGQPGQFDVNDTVGEVTFQGAEVVSIDLEAGRDLLGMDDDFETAGELVVGNLRLDVPEPPNGWESVHFRNRNQANEAGEGDRVVYVSPDRTLTVRLDGTRVSNKWSMRVLNHGDPLPTEPSDDVLLFGPDAEDSASDRITLTHGNVVDAQAPTILMENFPSVEEAEEMFEGREEDEEEDEEEPPEDFGRTIEGTFDDEVIEAGEVEEEVSDEDGDDVIELPVHVEDDFENGWLYAPPANTVRLAVAQQIDLEMTEELGDASQFAEEEEVGIAVVTDADDPMDREFVRVEPDGEGEEPEQAVAAEPELSRAEAETIIEQASLGVTVDLQMMAEEFSNFNLDVDESEVRERGDPPGEGVRFMASPERISVTAADTLAESVHNALERWEEQAAIDELEPGQVADINQRREALMEQLGVELPLLDQPTVEGMSEGDIERIIEEGTQGLDVEVSVNPDADSIRIQLEQVPDSQATYSAALREVQGQASNPAGAVREALNQWEQAIDRATVEVDRVNRRRGRLAREFDITLPEVEEPVTEEAPERERGELLDEWNAIMEDLETVPIDERRLVGQDDTPIPIEVDEEFAQFADEEEKMQIEQGLQVHHTEDIHDDVHAFIAQLMGAEPENFYDSSKESDLPGYDLHYTFTLTRTRAPGEWTNPRFAPSTLFEILSPLDGDRIKIIARGAPLA